MAPINNENLKAAQELSKLCLVKHISPGYLETTIVDEEHLFQFKESPTEDTGIVSMRGFANAFYTGNLDYVEKMKNTLNDIWESALIPSITTLESILGFVGRPMAPLSHKDKEYIKKVGNPYAIIDEKPSEIVSEKEILEKILHAKKFSAKDEPGVIDRMYATAGVAVIHPPSYFNLPDIMIMVYHIEEQSGLGKEDAAKIYLWLETPTGYTYVPVAIIGVNPLAHDFWKSCYIGVPAGQNTHLVNKDEIQIRVHGNTLFAGWTVPIPLHPPKYSLPPACLLIEGHGKVKTVVYSTVPPSGQKHVFEQNYFDAFVTFFHPTSQYSGPGTDGYFIRDMICTTFPQEENAL
jgi:hypothetical protein